MRKFREKNNAKISPKNNAKKNAKISRKNKAKISQKKFKLCEKTQIFLQKIHSLIAMVERMYCGRTDRNLLR